MSSFLQELQKNWREFSQNLMSEVKSNEQMNLSMDAEDSLFLRFNNGKVRQNTQVEQNYLELTLQSQDRTAKRKITLTRSLSENLSRSRLALDKLRKEIKELEPDPFQIKMENRGSSQKTFPGKSPSVAKLIEDISLLSQKIDLVGFFAGGPRISANCNSEGQNHWFSNENFFFDYSIYSGERAVASVISGSEWNESLLRKDLSRSLDTLSHLGKPIVSLAPGKYRTYLAPIATAELLNIFNWQGVGMADYKRGRSFLKPVAEGSAHFSEKFTLTDNFDLGLSPSFNSLGEVAPNQLEIIKQGAFQQFLTSTRSAKEFQVESNGAPPEEYGRNFEISPGTLAENEILKQLGTGLYLSHLHYLNYSDVNSARLTGMTRYAALWVEQGEIRGPINNLRFDHSLIDLFGKDLLNFTRESRIIPSLSTYSERQLGGVKVPGTLIQDMNFTL